jgi:dephospho-CoA kinase
MTYVLGLTGSIGMGKSTTAQILHDMGLPIWDADAAVHRLYAKGGVAVQPIAHICPAAVVDDMVDRTRLRRAIAQDPDLLTQVQHIVHPILAAQRSAFIQASRHSITVLDIPLLFETGADQLCDGILVVTAPPEIQRQRVLQRGLTQVEFETILARQMPDAEKRQRADWVVETHSIEHVKQELALIVKHIEKISAHA